MMTLAAWFRFFRLFGNRRPRAAFKALLRRFGARPRPDARFWF